MQGYAFISLRTPLESSIWRDSYRGEGIQIPSPHFLCYDSRNRKKAQDAFYGPLGDGPRSRECPAAAGISSELPKTVPLFLSVFGLGLDFGPVADSFLLFVAQGLRIRLLVQPVFQCCRGVQHGLGSIQGGACAVPGRSPHGTQRAPLHVHLGNHKNFSESMEQSELDPRKDDIGDGRGSADRTDSASDRL